MINKTHGKAIQMENKGIAVPVDIYGKDGDMIKVEFNTTSGEHIIDAVWDPRDEQTSEKRTDFRTWAYRLVEQKGYEVKK
jgi:hypothetical protein